MAQTELTKNRKTVMIIVYKLNKIVVKPTHVSDTADHHANL